MDDQLVIIIILIQQQQKTTNTFMNEIDENDNTLCRNQPVTVPLTITMLIIAAYIWAGSMIFHNFEQWTMIQSGYFCFITLCRNNIKIKKKKNFILFFSF